MRKLLLAAVLLIPALAWAQARPDADILAELLKKVPPAAGITLAIREGVVTATGQVSTVAQKQNILTIIRRTIGVRQVVDRITVVPAQPRSDADIAAAARGALQGNLSSEEISAINVRVAGGVVTLSGTLPSSYPTQVAELLVSWVPGVVGVANDITVVPPTPRSDAGILADIQSRYRSNPFIQQQNVHVDVNQGVVSLTGIVDSPLAADQAEAVARFVPGVVQVRNLLFVRYS
ncbi:MAG: BON domain-containing protein [Armatimonadota bacterium]